MRATERTRRLAEFLSVIVLEDNDTLGTLANDLRCCDESVLLSDFIFFFFFFKKCPQLSSCFC